MESLLHCGALVARAICRIGQTDLRYSKDQLVERYEVDDPLAEVERLHESTNSAPLDSLPYSMVDGLAIFRMTRFGTSSQNWHRRQIGTRLIRLIFC